MPLNYTFPGRYTKNPRWHLVTKLLGLPHVEKFIYCNSRFCPLLSARLILDIVRKKKQEDAEA